MDKQLVYVPKEKSTAAQETAAAPKQLLADLRKDRNVKIVDSIPHFRDDVQLNDIAINARGLDEDKVYAEEPWYRTNVRRGNTIVELYEGEKVSETFYGRKGFEKFFDLMYEYILFNLGEFKDLSSLGFKQADEHKALHGIIFGKVEPELKQNKKIGVYKLVKANGENAQVTWCGKLNAWIIASKNVSLLARHRGDLKKYDAQRYHFAKLIGDEWFNQVERLDKEGKLADLKQAMDNMTFVGEYCGNQDYQHLVKYNEIAINFVAIVDNNSAITCISPKEAFATFDKFGLNKVGYKHMGEFENKKDFNEALKNIYLNVAETEIDVEEEGSVIYIVSVDKNGVEKALSLSKLKTLEYRIFRKLREKLRTFIARDTKKGGKKGGKQNQPKDWSFNFNKMVKETKELCQETKPPMPIEYYFTIGKKAFEFAEKYPNNTQLIHDQYITFLSLLLYRIAEGKELEPKDFSNEMINKVMPIPWCEYYKKIQFEKGIEGPSSASSGVTTFVIIPMGIPGMGKTYAVEHFKNLVSKLPIKAKFDSVSSDNTRKQAMDEQIKKNPKLSEDKAFENSRKNGVKYFNDQLVSLLKSSEKLDCNAHFIFIDKNHPPNAISGTMETIQNNATTDFKTIALVPEVKDQLKLKIEGRENFYPFSMDFILTSLHRVQTRKDHPTLKAMGAKSAGITAMFVNFYRNVALNGLSITKNGFSFAMPIPFSVEDGSFKYPKQLADVFCEVLTVTKPGSLCQDNALLDRLNKEYENAKLDVPNPTIQQLESALNEFITNNLLPTLSQSSPKEESKQASSTSKPKEISYTERQVEEETKTQGTAAPTMQPESEPFKPKKMPSYLGIFAKQDPHQDICRYVQAGLELLTAKYDDKTLNNHLDEFKSSKITFEKVNDSHVTTLFVGGDKKKADSEHFKTFRENIEMDIKLVGFAMVPGGIIAGICYPDQSVIKIQNDFPHVTLMTASGWKPVQSNDLLKSLCDKNGPLGQEYKNNGFEKTEAGFVGKYQVKFGRGIHTAYVVKPKYDLVIPGITRAFPFNK